MLSQIKQKKKKEDFLQYLTEYKNSAVFLSHTLFFKCIEDVCKSCFMSLGSITASRYRQAMKEHLQSESNLFKMCWKGNFSVIKKYELD